ncbi:hypothetical protein V6N12_048808 [Hibiscus sabdariffa]|uniref:Uncharacterized protein n=1 Tax=Hibiscus sabdariffa TaxID=183260 RepID=A0ABR2EIC8_9ROSI
MLGSSMESFFHGWRLSLRILTGLNCISMDLIAPLKAIVMACVGVFLHAHIRVMVYSSTICLCGLSGSDGSLWFLRVL